MENDQMINSEVVKNLRKMPVGRKSNLPKQQASACAPFNASKQQENHQEKPSYV
ncbi:hypothetical protein KHX94_06795 [Shewanella dokdonensis]|uniref:Uncharacterized protein n=1 Tax=Shewanella dokdonensis TaxID=712036 RepID=A0ABX8DJW6_9GAMM|nr:hypothetical protein [Shewanella dokdonensis]QVK24252.1 hypothetical protein KHX94_06795 [Shewanella dokdonensis]